NQTAALNTGDPNVPLWDIQTGAQSQSLQGPTTTSLSALFSGDGSELLLVSYDGHLRLWNLASRTMVFDRRSDGKFESAAFSADGRFAVMGASDGTLYLWDMTETQVRETGRMDSGETKQVAYLPGSNQLVALQAELGATGPVAHLTVWDALTGAIIR